MLEKSILKKEIIHWEHQFNVFLKPLSCLNLWRFLLTNFLWLVCLNFGFLTALWLSSVGAYILNWEQKEFITHTKLCSEINLEQQNSNHLIAHISGYVKLQVELAKGNPEITSHFVLSPVSVRNECKWLLEILSTRSWCDLQLAHKWTSMSSATKERIRPPQSLSFNTRYLLFYAFIFIDINIIFRIN